MEIKEIRSGFVAEVTGRNREILADRDGDVVKKALLAHSVVIMRGMELAPREQVALTRLLGPPEVVTDLRNHHPDSTDILVIKNAGTTPVVGNTHWHSDRSFLPEPTRFTVLRADVVPDQGGDTLFADMTAAHRELDEEWRSMLTGAEAVHSYDTIARTRSRVHDTPLEQGYARKYPPTVHPLVRAHPESGTPALYLNELCMAALHRPDRVPVTVGVAELHAYATQERFVHRHHWNPGDVVVWDNARVLHRASDLPPGLSRVLHRTTTAGVAPRAPQEG
ncbi:TauD/TfdA family dioxygenase [Nocardiopsis sp. MG754419]|uniref:TauD/TfdA dioxygenase family protein n=1 Tax=Nocardiopsis sp. MG754419 TaxID=2259865 RepID=UPI001BA8611E|nr:TauD/TfdA family dioxygenase [Nocardiopsis sp. MG754419]